MLLKYFLQLDHSVSISTAKQVCKSTIMVSTSGSRKRLTSSAVSELIYDSTSTEDVFNRFQSLYDGQVPVVLRGYAQEYPALSKWNNLDYLLQVVGPNVVCDVEVGAYNQGDRLALPFQEYIDYLRLWQETYATLDQKPPSDQVLYLAQNDMNLFPALLQDIQIPDMCRICGEGELYSSMLWLGPRGCISPLHYDPLDNILLQLVGRKRVTLISRDTNPEFLYMGEHGQQYNTSAVNVENPNFERHPLFAKVKVYTLEILPGDALFIPSKWLHHVRSLDLSASVNFWWR
jgi:hypothetical protein